MLRRFVSAILAVLLIGAQGAAAQGMSGNVNLPLTPSGSLQTSDQRLVLMPFRSGAFIAGQTGTAPVPSVGAGFPDNDDGTSTGMFMSVPASSSFLNASVVGEWFWGDIFGLRLDATSGNGYTGDKVGLTIDGVAYPVNNAIALDPVQQTAVAQVGPNTQIIATNLGPGRHWAQITFPGRSDRAAIFGLLGYVVAANAGYQQPTRSVSLSTDAPHSLTATTWLSLSAQRGYGIRSVIFANNTASSAVVDVRDAAKGVLLWSQTVAAASSVIFDASGYLPGALDVRSSVTNVTATLAVQL